VGGSFKQKMHFTAQATSRSRANTTRSLEPSASLSVDLGGAVNRVLVEVFRTGERTKVVLTHEGYPTILQIHFSGHQGIAGQIDRMLDGVAV